MITRATSDGERQEVLQHFLSTFDNIDLQAVPPTRYDDLYEPLVAVYRDDSDGSIVGAALTCRSQAAVGWLVAQRRGLPQRFSDFSSVLGKHSELDLISVLPSARNHGVGSKLVNYLEQQLQSRGVRVWFGHVTSDLNTDRLRSFYTSHKFKVTDYGQPLPPLLGRSWVLPATEPAAFSFYKRI